MKLLKLTNAGLQYVFRDQIGEYKVKGRNVANGFDVVIS